MRLLHTSDWHLGRSLYREDLLDHQAAALDHLVELAVAESVQAVLVAGDVFDRAVPPVGAVELFGDALRRLAERGIAVVVVAGNHDSPARLGLHERLLESSRVFVRSRADRVGAPVLLGDGEVDVAVYPLPYLDGEPAVAVGSPARRHACPVAAAMDLVRADLAGRPAGTRSVVVSHAFVTGGVASDSERELAVGGIGDVPAAVFAGVDYVALGHLHGPQVVAEGLRYSGSPLAYSFSEAGQRKSSVVVDVTRAGVRTSLVDAPEPRRLSRLRGTLDGLLTDPRLAGHEADWLEVTLTDAVRPAEPLERLRRRFPGTLLLRFAPERPAGEATEGYRARVRGRSDLDLAVGFVEHVRGGPATAGEVAWLRQAFAAVAAAEREAPAVTGPVSGTGTGSGSGTGTGTGDGRTIRVRAGAAGPAAPSGAAAELVDQTDRALAEVLPDAEDDLASLASPPVAVPRSPAPRPAATGTEG